MQNLFTEPYHSLGNHRIPGIPGLNEFHLSDRVFIHGLWLSINDRGTLSILPGTEAAQKPKLDSDIEILYNRTGKWSDQLVG